MENKLKIPTLKEKLLDRFTDTYVERKDYFDRFIGVFVLFFIFSMVAQAYSGFSEMGFFKKHFELYLFPYPYTAALCSVILYEILKYVVTFKAYHEYLNHSIKKVNYFFIILALTLSVGSWYFSLNGIETITRNSSSPPIDIETPETDRIYNENLTTLNSSIAEIKARYTYKGVYYMPKTGNRYHTGKQVDADRNMLNRLKDQKSELTANYSVQRTLGLEQFKEKQQEYQIALNKDIQSNRYFVIAAEIAFAICSYFNYFFAANSAFDHQKNRSRPSPPSPDPNDKGNKKETDKNHSAVINMQNRNNQPVIRPITGSATGTDNTRPIELSEDSPLNSPLYTVSHSVYSEDSIRDSIPNFSGDSGESPLKQTHVIRQITQNNQPDNLIKLEALPDRSFILRYCDVCGDPFLVDVNKDPYNEEKKTKRCSKACKRKAEKKNVYAKRSKKKYGDIENQPTLFRTTKTVGV